MSDALSQFLSDAGRRPFIWGQSDCLMFLADWWMQRTGVDPARGFRSVYRDERGARRVMFNAGGIEKHITNCLGTSAQMSLAPQRGDIALVKLPLMLRGRRLIMAPVGAICVSEQMWAIKAKAGITAGNFPVMQAWTA